ncbi:GroES-like protein [Microthyrium microscopicum]|uniref:GroES-like protein n=1 Tax=Microthyrium microscopicum TaxID=703497 RepID=A0A6A6U3B5_9PEZI|nr:GroES-like protein [Microthyrium microscopicum]
MTGSQVKAAVLHGAGDMRVELRSIEPPAPDEVQVAIKCTGICGSDVHYYRDYRVGNNMVKEPLVLGHESAGVVVAVGETARGQFEVGDRVALEVGVPCEECEQCKAGRYNICPDMRFRSSARYFPHAQGTLQQRINHAARYCHKLPSTTTFEQGALVEPLSVAIHANQRASLQPGKTVLVLGAGTIGLLVAAIAKVNKADLVVIADINADRVHFAVDNGFAHKGWEVPPAYCTRLEEQLRAAKSSIQHLTDVGLPSSFDAVFECTGAQASMQTAIFAAKSGGKVMVIGMGSPNQHIPITEVGMREVDLIGVFRYANAYPKAVELISSPCGDGPNFGSLITHRTRGFGEIDKAFELATKPVDNNNNLVLKVLIDFTDLI